MQKEFIKNREDIINRFTSDTLTKLSVNYKEEVVNRFTSFKDKNKILLEDFPEVGTKLSRIKVELESISTQLSNEVEALKKRFPSEQEEDDLLRLVSEMNLISNLSSEELKFLKTEFDTLRKNIDQTKIKSELTKPQKAFPGLADIIEKPSDPYGDYLIYHEIVKFLKLNNQDAIFLTYDTTKGDWVKEDKSPHSHYIQVTFCRTKQNLFFIDADRFFDAHLKQHFNSLVPNTGDNYSPKSQFEKDFIVGFVALERLIRMIAEFVVIDDYERLPIKRIITEFLRRGYIDSNFAVEFQSLNSFKNILTHALDRKSIDSLTENDFINWNLRLESALGRMRKLDNSL